MSEWAIAIYGNPCKECGFHWAISRDQAVALIAGVPKRMVQLVDGRGAALRHPHLGWSIGEYVCHVGDNLRIYAERFGGILAGSLEPLAPYDQDALARARQYSNISFASSLWSLEHAAHDWCEVAGEIDPTTVVVHPERGQQSVLDLILSSAHDAAHHLRDIERSIEANT